MPDKNKPVPRGALTVDLSTGKKSRGKKKSAKGPTPLVQETINLSTPKADQLEKDMKAAENPPVAQRSALPEKRRLQSEGNRLADLIDPETLAKLRG